jgi:nucleoside-diphosphate-sugar epimerase
MLVRVALERKVEAVVHLASLLGPESDLNPVMAVQINSGGMANVLEMARIAGIKRVVFASSESVFADFEYDVVIANDSAYRPVPIASTTGPRCSTRCWQATTTNSMAWRRSDSGFP